MGLKKAKQITFLGLLWFSTVLDQNLIHSNSLLQIMERLTSEQSRVSCRAVCSVSNGHAYCLDLSYRIYIQSSLKGSWSPRDRSRSGNALQGVLLRLTLNMLKHVFKS